MGNEPAFIKPRGTAKELIDSRDGLVVVETFDEKNYRGFHLPGAYNVPLNDSFVENIGNVAPEKSAPVPVYCMDAECEASSKAAK